MKATFLVAFFVLVIPRLSLCAPPTTNIGEITISLPSPKGFAQVGPEIQWLNDQSELFVTDGNRQLAMFIDERELGKAMMHAGPDLSRTFVLQVRKQLEPIDCSLNDFAQFKHQLKTNYDALYKKARQDIPDLLDQAVAKGRNDLNVDVALRLSDMIPLPPHDESENALAFSAYIKLKAISGRGTPAAEVVTMTSTALYLRGKILFLYTYGTRDDLEWTRAAAADWATQIVNANPPSQISNPIPLVTQMQHSPRVGPPNPSNPGYSVILLVLGIAFVWWIGKLMNKVGSK